jgi:hypothetical protein
LDLTEEREPVRISLWERPLQLYEESRSSWLTIGVGATILGTQRQGWSWIASIAAGAAVLAAPLILAVALLIVCFVWVFFRLFAAKFREEGLVGVGVSTYRAVFKPILFGKRGATRPKSGT